MQNEPRRSAETPKSLKDLKDMSKEAAAAEQDSTSRTGASAPRGSKRSPLSWPINGRPPPGRRPGLAAPITACRFEREWRNARSLGERRIEEELPKTIPHCWLFMGCLQGPLQSQHIQWPVSASSAPPSSTDAVRDGAPFTPPAQTMSGFTLQRRGAGSCGSHLERDGFALQVFGRRLRRNVWLRPRGQD